MSAKIYSMPQGSQKVAGRQVLIAGHAGICHCQPPVACPGAHASRGGRGGADLVDLAKPGLYGQSILGTLPRRVGAGLWCAHRILHCRGSRMRVGFDHFAVS